MDGKKRVKLEELLPIIEEKLSAGGTVVLPITGTSMLPLLVAGWGHVTLKSAVLPLEKDAIPFYRRNDGAFVLHRKVGEDENGYVMCGDNQWVMEHGITDKNIIGEVAFITRKGKTFSVDSRRYRLYVKLWKFLFPVRKYIVKIRGKLGK